MTGRIDNKTRMRAGKGSRSFQAISDRVGQLRAHGLEIPTSHAHKTLRKFAMKEAADILRINQHTFRSYLQNLADKIPTGELNKSNRRYFTLEEIHEIQRFLFEVGKIDPKTYPRKQGDEPCVSITCLSLRKGSGTSTLSAHIAANLALKGYRVLSCDLDPQATLTNMLGVTPELDPDMPTAHCMIRNVERVQARDVIQKTCLPNLDLIPASMNLTEFEYETAFSFHTRIAKAIEPVRPDYDVLILDTPPHLSHAVAAALFASHGVLMPLNPSMLDVRSLAGFLHMAGVLMEDVEAHTPDHGFDFVKFLITNYETTDRPQVQMASFLRAVLGTSVMTSEFLNSTAVTTAGASNQTVFELEPRDVNRKTYDRTIESVGRITAEIETEINKARGRTGP